MDDVSREANQSSTNTQSSHHPNAEGIRSSLHGTIYQLKLSILFLQKALEKGYKFKLYSEKNDANKFDDVIFKYNKNNKYRFLQAKHKLEPEKNRITMNKLCSDNNKEPFSLQQYFIAFRKISKNINYKDNIEDFIICTNTDFSNDIKNGQKIIEQRNDGDILYIKGGNWYKFDFEKNTEIQEKLQDASDVKRLAKELYKIINSEDKSINLKQELFKAYHIPLIKEVLKRHDEKEGYCVFQKNFTDEILISVNAQLLRKALEQESINASDLLKQNKHTKLELRNAALDDKEQQKIINDFWNKAKEKEFKVSSSFGKHPKLTAEKLARANNYEIKKLDEVLLPNDGVTNDDIREFFKKLVLAVNQPKEEKLRGLIEEKIFSHLDYLTNKKHAELIYNFVQSQMLDWLKNPKSDALTEKDNFFKQGREKVYDITSNLSSTEYIRHFQEFNIEFTDRVLAEIKKFITSEEQEKTLVMKTNSENLLLTQAKVHQVEPTIPLPLEILLVAKKSGKSLQDLSKDTLVIICENETSFETKYVQSIYSELLTDSSRKLILITCNDNISWFDYGSKQYKQIKDETTLKDLSKDFVLNKILRKKVTFLGQRTHFTSVLDIDDAILESEFPNNLLQNLEEVMDAKVIIDIIFNEDISVGDNLPNFQNKNSRYYDPFHIDIRRGLNAQIIEENRLLELLSNIKTGIFAFSNITDGVKNFISRKNKDLRTFQNIQECDEKFFDGKYYILRHENPMNDFKELCKRHTDNVSWFEFSDCNYKLKYSDVVAVFTRYTKLTLIDNIKNINDPVLILAGDPGIGKSTVLTTYSRELGSSSWVIRINLKEHDEYLKDCYVDNEDNLIKFLIKNIDMGRDSSITKMFLKYRLKHQGKIILLLDGYDEISDESQKNVIDLIKFMMKTKGRVWITTRTHEQRNIENALGIFSYSLRRFDNEEQIIFFKKFWTRALNTEQSSIEDCVNVFTKQLIELFQTRHIEHLIAIASQTCMTADFFMEKCKQYTELRTFDINFESINNLYSQLIRLQYERYFEKKGIYKNLSKFEQETLSASYTKYYGFVAMKMLFHDNEICKELLEMEKLNLEIYKDLSKIGFISRIGENGIAEFIHQSYAEYFAVKYIDYYMNEKMFKICIKCWSFLKSTYEYFKSQRISVFLDILDNENQKSEI